MLQPLRLLQHVVRYLLATITSGYSRGDDRVTRTMLIRVPGCPQYSQRDGNNLRKLVLELGDLLLCHQLLVARFLRLHDRFIEIRLSEQHGHE